MERMREGVRRGGRVVGVTVAVLGVLLGGVGWDRAAAAGVEPAAEARGADHRSRAVEALEGRTAVTTSAQVRSAAAGDAVSIDDPIDVSDARGDVRQVGVGSGHSDSLLFTMQVEQYTDPRIDPEWTAGFTTALWGLDTSGDSEVDVIIEMFNTGFTLVGEVIDATSGALICEGGATSDAAARTYTAQVFHPGCIGDVKQPAVAGIFIFDAATGPEVVDEAPNGGGLVRFSRPASARAAGGYAIVSRNAGFQRYGAFPPYQCGVCAPTPGPGPSVTPGGTFEDYIGPGPVVATASARPFEPALWSVTDDGEVSTQDGAEYYDDLVGLPLNQPIVGMAVLPDRSGYWLVARDGGIFSFGDAEFYGSTGGIRLNQPIVGMAATPTGEGYWLVASDGGIFTYGDAQFHGSTGALRLNKPVVGMAPGLQGQGYWLVASDGGIFAFGLAFHGSTGGISLQQPIVGMAATRSGGGYRFVARDGGIFTFGDAEFRGSGATPGRTDVVGIATA